MSLLAPKSIQILLLFFIAFLPFSLSSDIACQTPLDQEPDTCPPLHACIEGQCVHKDIFPLTFQETVGSIALMILAGLANAGGLGGGALLTPILLIFFQYRANKAIMLVYSIVFGGSFGNFLNVAFQRDPRTDKPYVNYDLSLICMPLMTLGAMVGILINRVLAPIIMIIGLILVMVYSGKKVCTEAKNQYRAETAEKGAPLIEPQTSPQRSKDVELASLSGPKRGIEKEEPISPELASILNQEHQLIPFKKVGVIAVLTLFVILTTMIRGSKDSKSLLGTEYCGSGYWLIYAIALLGCGLIYMKGLNIVQHSYEVKTLYNHRSENQGFIITPRVIKRMMPLSLLAGVLAGLLGLGGGMVMSPTLLQLGMDPQMLAATVGFFVVQTSLITLVQSVMSGDVTQKEVIFFMVVAFVGSYVVSLGLNYLVKKYKRPSLILMTLCFVLLVSLVVMPVFSVYKSIDRPEEMFTFHPLC